MKAELAGIESASHAGTQSEHHGASNFRNAMRIQECVLGDYKHVFKVLVFLVTDALPVLYRDARAVLSLRQLIASALPGSLLEATSANFSSHTCQTFRSDVRFQLSGQTKNSFTSLASCAAHAREAPMAGLANFPGAYYDIEIAYGNPTRPGIGTAERPRALLAMAQPRVRQQAVAQRF